MSTRGNEEDSALSTAGISGIRGLSAKSSAPGRTQRSTRGRGGLSAAPAGSGVRGWGRGAWCLGVKGSPDSGSNQGREVEAGDRKSRPGVQSDRRGPAHHDVTRHRPGDVTVVAVRPLGQTINHGASQTQGKQEVRKSPRSVNKTNFRELPILNFQDFASSGAVVALRPASPCLSCDDVIL